MTPAEFKTASQPLVDAYGDKIFSAVRLGVVFDAVKHADVKVWREAVKEIIAEFIYAPPVSKIREVLRVVQSKHPVNQHWSNDGIVRASAEIPDQRHDSSLTPEQRAQKVVELKLIIAKAGNLGRGT